MYDKIQVGDQARVRLKKETSTKAYEPKFPIQLYNMIHVEKVCGCLINNTDHSRVWWIHELRLINFAEEKYTDR